MATLPSSAKCLISRGLESAALDNPDLIKQKGVGFCTDTNRLLFFYKDQLCRMQGQDVGARPADVDLAQVGHLKNDDSVTVAGTDRLWSFKGYLTVFAAMSPRFNFEPFSDAEFETIT